MKKGKGKGKGTQQNFDKIYSRDTIEKSTNAQETKKSTANVAAGLYTAYADFNTSGGTSAAEDGGNDDT